METKFCNKDFLINTLVDLIKIPSPSGKEEEIAAKISKTLKGFGYRPRIDEYHNVIAEVGSGKTILLNSHVDTVPPIGNWSVDPYSGKVSDGRIYGLGASDDKAGIAAMLEIARILNENKPSRGRILFLFTSNEESVKKEGREALIGKINANVGLCLDHFIDTQRRIVEVGIGCKGLGNFEVEVYGKAHHSSEPRKGINAIYRAAKLIEAIQNLRLPTMEEPFHEETMANATRMNTDGWPTMIPDLCKLTINYRALPQEKKEESEERILNFVERTLEKDFTVNLNAFHEGYLIDLDHPIVKIAEKSVHETGFTSKIAIAKYWIDSAMLTNLHEIPTICMGLATKDQAHVKDEYELIEDLLHGTEIVLRTVFNYLES